MCIRDRNRADLFMALVDEGTTVAGVFTKSLCPSAPVDWSRSILGSGTARAVVCNSGNANAFTGKAGATSAKLTAETVAGAFAIAPESVHLASTGVIGESLPDERLVEGLEALTAGLTPSGPKSWEAAANAIRTTDTFPKGAYGQWEIGGSTVNIVGIAKGSGMIAPDMATMLGFVFTDAAVAPDVLQKVLSDSTETSYNRITVDSHTSTSDSVWLFATGAAGNDVIDSVEHPDYPALRMAVTAVNHDLAQQIVRDGEGATKLVEITVSGAEDDPAASTIALSIANSPLVKTALAAEDANWGRIVMAVGKAGQRADRDALKIMIGDELVADQGVQAPGYSEELSLIHI